ncbi:MAG: hypothetical protein QHH09_04725 [Microgenomates group bacterium]|nr:hypothetical protein [Microgenomates group bacterium]
MNLLQVFLYFWGFKFLNAPAHIHYFGAIYLSIFFIIAYVLFFLKKILPEKIWFFLIAFLTIFYLFFNFKEYRFLIKTKEGQIEHSRKVADFLADKIGGQPFNIATWPVDFTEDNYVYFLLLKNLKPADRRKLEITNQMFVLCNKEPCLVTNSPSWNISMFGKAKIDKIWKFEGLKIYKLIHEQ